MGLFTEDFLSKRRQELMDLLVDFECEADDKSWFKIEEQKREVKGNFIEFTFILKNTEHSAHKITGLRIQDKDGTVVAARDMSIEINSTQSILILFRISYQEV